MNKEEALKSIYKCIPVVCFILVYMAIRDNAITCINTTEYLIFVGFIYMLIFLRKLESLCDTTHVFCTWCIVNGELLKTIFGDSLKGVVNEDKKNNTP